MRNISSYHDEELRNEQFKILIEVLEKVKNDGDMKIFIKNFLTDSELAYTEQRLAIMRMLLKKFSYSKIQEKLGVQTNTINNAQKRLENGGDQFQKIISSYRFKPKNNIAGSPKFPRMPGSII